MNPFRLDGVDVCHSWLTQRSFRAAYCELLVNVTPKNKTKALAAFQKQGEFGAFSGLRVSGIADLSFLADYPRLLYLEVLDQKRVNTRYLDGLSNLRGLRLTTPGAGVDFSCFPELEVFVGDWHVDNSNVHRCEELRQLRAWQFKPKSLDLCDIANTTRLEWLELIQTNITSLTGLETLEDLRYFKLAYAPQLESLDILQSAQIGVRELHLHNLRNLSSYVPIASLSSLRRLWLSSCATMPNLHWTKGLDRLDFFAFVETNVENGDLSPLLQLPKLRYAGTSDKRHYNYKSEALNQILTERANSGNRSIG
jgi:protein phosphatase 1 regulatory subunit 7